MKIIKTEYGKGTQSIELKEIRESEEGLKIKIDIKSDSYSFQSYARVSTFDPNQLKWNVLTSIHYSVMETPNELYYKVPQNAKDGSSVALFFKADQDKLIKEAEDILGVSFSAKPAKKAKMKWYMWKTKALTKGLFLLNHFSYSFFTRINFNSII